MRLKNIDLIVALFIVAINVVWIQIPNRSPVLGVIFALPLIFILPGYLLTQTLFSRRSPAPGVPGNLLLKPKLELGRPINVADHVILSFGLSIAMNIVMGFALEFLADGVTGVVVDALSRTHHNCICAASCIPSTPKKCTDGKDARSSYRHL